MKRLSRLTISSVCLAFVFAAAPANAHHSFAMFDFTKLVTITGTVKEFQWTNPHVILWVTADAKDGEPPAVWSLELTSPGNLTRSGWNRKAVSAGDKVVVDLNPLRNGSHGGALVKVTVAATGQVFATNLRDMEKPGLKSPSQVAGIVSASISAR